MSPKNQNTANDAGETSGKPKIVGAVRLNDRVYREGEEDELQEAFDAMTDKDGNPDAKARAKSIEHLTRHGTITGFGAKSAAKGEVSRQTLNDPTLAAAEGLSRSSKTFTEPAAGRVVDSPAPDALNPDARRDRSLPEDEPERATRTISARDLQEGRGGNTSAASASDEDDEGNGLTDYSRMKKAELKAEAETRSLTVTRRDGEDGDPLVEDYVAALEADDAKDRSGNAATPSETDTQEGAE